MKRFLISFGVSFLFFALISFIYFSYLARTEQSVGTMQPRDDFQETLATLSTDFWVNQEYEEVAQEAEALMKSYDDDSLYAPGAMLEQKFDATMLYLTALARSQEPSNQETIYNLSWDIIDNAHYTRSQRDWTLLNVLLYTTNNIDNGEVDVEVARSLFYNNERLFSLSDGQGNTVARDVSQSISSADDIKTASWPFFEYLATQGFLDSSERTLALALMARYHTYLPQDTDQTLSERYQDMQAIAEPALEQAYALEEEQSREWQRMEKIFSLMTVYTLHQAYLNYLLANEQLLTTDGDMPQEIIARLNEMYERYAQESPSFSLTNLHAEAGFSQACVEAQRAQMEGQDRSEKIRSNLAFFHTLSDESLAQRHNIASMADRDHLCHQAVVYIVNNNIDPGLKEILINKVGSWQESDFSN